MTSRSHRSLGLALGMLALAAIAWPGVAPAGPNDAAAAEDRPLDGAAIPSEKSKPPKATEWPAAGVQLTRRGPAAATCRAHMVREWMRVRCEGQIFAISLIAGSPEGVAFWLGGTAEEPRGEILMPVRRGDRRVFQVWAPGKDAAGMFVPRPMLVVQEQWVEGQKDPIVTAW